jgi:quercetin 2,3-dioxygenase
MHVIRRSGERGHFDHGWLNTYHTFSFADFHDPSHMGFRSLRVINDDRVAPGQGFGMHPHRDMEIITIVLDGELEHRDSMGNGAVIQPNEVQCMTAGTGLLHSEFNPSATEPVHLYQIWLLPERRGLTPRYAQTLFDPAKRQAAWQRVASHSEADGALLIHQDAELWRTALKTGESRDYDFSRNRHGWLQVLNGAVTADGVTLTTGDALAMSDESKLQLRADQPSELLLFDLA